MLCNSNHRECDAEADVPTHCSRRLMLSVHSGELPINTCTFLQFSDIKEELTGLREPMEEMRGLCKQLQSQLKTIPDCSESAYEAEADTLMDTWLDVRICA